MSTRVDAPHGLAGAKPAVGAARGSGAARSLRAAWRFARRKPLGALGGFIVVALLVMAVFAEQLAPYGYDETIRGSRMKPPSTAHWLGTDNLSRDMWSRIVYGARVSVTVGVATIGLALVLATAIGVSSGYFGGAYDLVSCSGSWTRGSPSRIS
jgi:peptide/nickel transport system permease protein